MRIERLARADQPTIAVHLRHVVRWQKNGVIALRVELAVSAVNNVRLRQHGAALGLEILDDELVLNGLQVGWSCLRLRKLNGEQGDDQRNKSQVDALLGL